MVFGGLVAIADIFLEMRWHNLIFYIQVKKMFVHLERLAKGRLSLNEMDVLTLFGKRASASLRMQDSLFLGWKAGLAWEERKALSSVLLGSAVRASDSAGGREGQSTLTWALSRVDSVELQDWVIHFNIWRILKRFFWYARYLVTRLLPRKYLRCQKVLSCSDIILKLRSSFF